MLIVRAIPRRRDRLAAAGEGTIFFALRGDRFDGNRFALAALDAGAACAVVDDPAVAASAGEAYAGRS